VIDLSLILNVAEVEPSRFVKFLDEHYDADEILRLLHEAEASLSPKADDGDAANYFFAYVKSIKELCKSALEMNMSVVHTQWDD
jgi:hypothetical protein